MQVVVLCVLTRKAPLNTTLTHSHSHTHITVLSRGRSHSPCYRFLSHWGDWIWVRSKSHMIFNSRSQLPEAIVIYTWIVRYVKCMCMCVYILLEECMHSRNVYCCLRSPPYIHMYTHTVAYTHTHTVAYTHTHTHSHTHTHTHTHTHSHTRTHTHTHTHLHGILNSMPFCVSTALCVIDYDLGNMYVPLHYHMPLYFPVILLYLTHTYVSLLYLT